jgi:methylase of polypeptide subunit release factors
VCVICAVGTDLYGVGVDISPDALAVASCNAQELGFKSTTSFYQGSFSDLSNIAKFIEASAPVDDHSSMLGKRALLSDTEKGFDIILCNPPYSSPVDSKKRLFQSRLAHEPMGALCNLEGGPYASYAAIARAIESLPTGDGLFKTNAHFYFEIGSGQEGKVKEIFSAVSRLVFVESPLDQYKMVRCLVYRSY